MPHRLRNKRLHNQHRRKQKNRQKRRNMPNPSPIKLLATNNPRLLRKRIFNRMRPSIHRKPNIQKQKFPNDIRSRRNRFRTRIRLNKTQRQLKMLRRKLMQLRSNSVGNTRIIRNRTRRRRIHPLCNRNVRHERTIPPRSIHLHTNKLRGLRNPTNRRPKIRQLLGSHNLSIQQILRHINGTHRSREFIIRTNHKSKRLAIVLTRHKRMLAKLGPRNSNSFMGANRKKRTTAKRRRRNILLRSRLFLHPISRLSIIRRRRQQLLLPITIKHMLPKRKSKTLF